MPRKPAAPTAGRRRTARSKPDGRPLPPPPETVPIEPAVENLRLRLDYVRDVLGLRIELVSLLASLSHKALRIYRSEKWNPSLTTLMLVDQTLQKHMPIWLEERRSQQS